MSSRTHLPTGSEELGAVGLYFAYGSNMHLKQMAARCPDSTLFAKGILRNYRWQVSSRGGGNVVRGSQEDAVEGLLFFVSPSNVQALRGYEGVEQQFFVEEILDIQVERFLDKELEGRTPGDVAQILSKDSSESGLTSGQSTRSYKSSESKAIDPGKASPLSTLWKIDRAFADDNRG